MSIDRAQIDAALATSIDPNTGRTFADTKNIRNVAVEGAKVSVDVVLGYPAKRSSKRSARWSRDALRAVAGRRPTSRSRCRSRSSRTRCSAA